VNKKISMKEALKRAKLREAKKDGSVVVDGECIVPPLQMMGKPDVTKCMMLSYYNDEKQINNLIVPLANFEVLFYKDTVEVKIPYSGTFNNVRTKWNWAAFTVAEDPKIEWAADWSDMGTFRLVHKMKDVTMHFTKQQIVLESKREDYGKDMWIPDKVRYDVYDEKKAV
jgi:hypothetical protein